MASRIFWSKQAKEDLRAIRAFIGSDAPLTARAYSRRLRAAVNRLRSYPFSGQVVPEFNREDIREVIHGYYRIVYKISEKRVDILAIYHGARLLDEDSF